MTGYLGDSPHSGPTKSAVMSVIIFLNLLLKNNTEKTENIFKSEQIMEKDSNLNETKSEDCFVETPQFTLLFDQCAGTLETVKQIIKE